MASFSRRGVLLSVGLGFLLVAASAGAERSWRLPRKVPRYEVSLEDGSGARLPTFRHDGRTFVLGERGERYAIRVENPTSERVEAVVSVDGRDAVSGRPGDYRAQRGYVIPAYGSIVIDGFRRSLDEVATFRFSDPEESYSARLGTPENVGVVGVAFFGERRRVEPRPAPIARERGDDPRADDSRAEGRSRSAPKSAPAPAKRRSGAGPGSAGAERGAASDSADNLGTEYGERRGSGVVEVSFERRSATPDRVVSLRYDDADGLEARGIRVYPRFDERPAREPEPFPESRFAAPPP